MLTAANGTPRLHRCGHCGKVVPRSGAGAACPIGGDCCLACAEECVRLGYCQLK
ncbi:MAG: hypothetical protein JW839_21825 [Candidatus Lokiarchaeota archaeon]|nr:hypothetical protein [Candidatus Lokiarchaeota archaeon]